MRYIFTLEYKFDAAYISNYLSVIIICRHLRWTATGIYPTYSIRWGWNGSREFDD